MKKTKALLATLIAALTLTALIAACGGGEPEEVTFNLEIKNGALVGEDSTLEVKTGRQDNHRTDV